MSNFSLVCMNVGLWDTSTKATLRSLDFCLVVMQLQVHAIMQTQLTFLSHAGPGEMWKSPQWDMAFVLVVPSLAIRCEWVFGLTAVWAHPHQANLPTLADATQRLMLLADEGANWPYANT